jgi:hypothetical protein
MRILGIALVLLMVFSAGHSAGGSEQPHAPVVSGPASEAPRTSIFVDHAGSDVAGRAFVKGIRDSIRTSAQFRLAETEEEANLMLVVVSVSPVSPPRAASAISLAYVANNEWRTLLGSAARFVGRDRAEAMGRAVLPELSAVLAAHDPAFTP